jgi:pimeloyl-ACP methyl ester carboxylesterase
VVVVLACSLLLLAACSEDRTDPPGEPTGTARTDPSVTVATAAFSESECPDGLSIAPPGSARCGTISVPERHEDPGGARVVLPVVTLDPGEGFARPDPVLFLQGGPGVDALAAAATISELPIAGSHLVVIIGQRGSPGADPSFDCPETGQVVVDRYAADLGTDGSRESYREAVRACFRRIAADGHAFDAYDSAKSADDLESARRALGHGEWNVYGVSYGTRLALELVRRHPGGVRSVVLDSVYPPEVDPYSAAMPNALRAFSELEAACAAAEACSAAHPDLLGRVAAMYQRLEAAPVDVTVPHPATGEPTTVRWDGDRAVRSAMSALYSSELIGLLPFLLASFEDGDFDLATTTYLQLVESGFADLAEGLFLAVQCRERAPFAQLDALQDQRSEQPAWLRASVADGETLEECDAWDADPADASIARPVTGEVPALVLAGRFDPVTPPSWGRAVAEAQARSWFVEFPAYSHGVSFQPCAREMVGWFIDDPSTEPDRTCLDSLPAQPGWVLPARSAGPGAPGVGE